MGHLSQETVFSRVLGDELRAARQAEGWTRENVAPHIQDGVSPQTLASWELGTRHISVVRFVATCLTIKASPMDVLTRVLARVFDDPQAVDTWVVDLAAAAWMQTPELAPLRNWALCRLTERSPGQPTIVQLTWPAIESLAYLCGADEVELVRRLPGPTHGPTSSSPAV